MIVSNILHASEFIMENSSVLIHTFQKRRLAAILTIELELTKGEFEARDGIANS